MNKIRYRYIKKVDLAENKFSKTRTYHSNMGNEIERPAKLTIAQIVGSEGYYLLYLDKDDKDDKDDKELTDTFHETLSRALDQANWEFGINNTDWEDWDCNYNLTH